jgi:hypothetical protein
MKDTKIETNRESDLIVELTGRYVAALLQRDTIKGNDYIVELSIEIAEEMVKQLKERGYLK